MSKSLSLTAATGLIIAPTPCRLMPPPKARPDTPCSKGGLYGDTPAYPDMLPATSRKRQARMMRIRMCPVTDGERSL